jgi:hypothetical protein
MRTTFEPQALSWLAAQLRWERLLDELRRDALQPPTDPVAERPQAA